MSVFANLEIEKAVQIGDKTRLNANKSFVAKGSGALTIMQITPGIGTPVVSVFDSIEKNRFLDWIFTDYAFDIDATNQAIDLDIGAGPITANIAPGAYNESDLLSQIELQLDSAGLTNASVSIDGYKKITISGDIPFKLLPETGPSGGIQILKHIGFAFDTDSSLSQISEPLEYGIRKLTLEVSNAALQINDMIRYLKVYTEFGDHLFCTDEDLRIHESDVPKYVEDGRATFKNVIRKSQELIVEYFSAKGMTDIDRNPLTKWRFPITNNLRDWSTFMSLKMIFDDLSMSPSDTYFQAAREYESMENVAKQKFVSIDFRKDGNALKDEYSYPNTCNLFMR